MSPTPQAMAPRRRIGAALAARGLIPAPDAPFAARAIAGTTNLAFDVRVGGDRYALRLLRPGARAPAPADEARALAEAFRLDLGPEPAGPLLDDGALVTRWLGGARPIRAGAETLAAAMRVLRRFHEGAAPLAARLDAPAALERLRREAGDGAPRWSRQAHAALDRALDRFATAPLVPSHGDASPRNILSGGGRLWLIDFEYAAMAPRAFDPAYLAVEAGLGPASAGAVAAAYGAPLEARDIGEAMLVAAALGVLWAATPAGAATMSAAARLAQVETLAATL